VKSPSRNVVIALVAGLFVWFFADALFHSGMFAFRDAAHFYYPLFKLAAEAWGSGRLPLWNPYENLGQPLAGDPTASVFYPGKLLFAMPIAYGWAYKLYVMTHVLLAAAGAFALARRLGAGVAAAGVSAISYAFCGNVLYQYCNVVFLVGAAWLPPAMASADRMLVERSTRCAVGFGTVLAMMVLGGDPQMAYNAGLLAILYAILLSRSPRSQALPGNAPAGGSASAEIPRTPLVPRQSLGTRDLAAFAGLLALAAVTAATLSAVQVFPSLELARRCGRNAPELADRFLARIEPDTHHEHTYYFSVGPWRLAEYVWPNVGGRQFPVHRRWLDVIPAEGRIWTPSLYMGIVPMLLAIGAMRWRHGEPRDRWLTWSALLFVLAALGHYGFGWLLQETHLGAGLGGPFGGLYWLMTLVLPGYAMFRYPAKLLVVAAFALSALAARGWDRAFDESPRSVRRWMLGIGGLSAILASGAMAIRPCWAEWLAAVPADPLFGPFDAAGSWRDLLAGLAQTAVVCAAGWWLLGDRRRQTRWTPAALLLLVGADLAVANRWMIVCAPASQWDEPSKVAQRLVEDRTGGDGVPPRVYRRSIWLRPLWQETSSPSRIADSMAWDRDTLWPKYNLPAHVAVDKVDGTMMIEAYRRFLLAGIGPDDVRALPAGVDSLDVARFSEYAILPANEAFPGGRRIGVDVPDATLWRNPQCLPRVWIAQRAVGEGESCRIVDYAPECVEIEARIAQPATVVLSEQFFPGWTLEVATAEQSPRSAPILRVSGVLRGATLPAGEHRLTFRYRPASLYWGAILSAAGWIGLAVIVAFRIGRSLSTRA